MKKKIKDLFLGFIIGVALSGTLTFALTTYPTDQVIYMRNNKEEILTDYMNDIYDQVYSGNATSDQIYKGKTALVNGVLLTGTGEINKIANLKKTTFTKTYSSQYGSQVSYGSYTANRIYYNIDITSNYSNCKDITSNNIAVERRSFTTRPYEFGGVGMSEWTYNPSTCTISFDTNGRKGFQASRSETFYISIFAIEEKTV